MSKTTASIESEQPKIEWLEENEKLIEKLETAFRAIPEKNRSDKVNQFYGLELNSVHLLIGNNTSSELLEDNTIFSLPFSAEWIIGVANVRGDVVPIINLEQLISGNIIEQTLNNTKIIIVGKGENAIGILLNQLPKPINFSNNEKLSDFTNLPEIISKHTDHAYVREDVTWVCINFSSFIQSLKD